MELLRRTRRQIMMKKYRPSNGTEGMSFMQFHCNQCIHENPHPDKKPKCDIVTLTMCYDLNDPEYPNEWCYNSEGQPTCTKFVKWDWGNDGDPNDPENPKAPITPNPRQKDLFSFYPNESDYQPEKNKSIKMAQEKILIISKDGETEVFTSLKEACKQHKPDGWSYFYLKRRTLPIEYKGFKIERLPLNEKIIAS